MKILSRYNCRPFFASQAFSGAVHSFKGKTAVTTVSIIQIRAYNNCVYNVILLRGYRAAYGSPGPWAFAPAPLGGPERDQSIGLSGLL